MNIESLEKMLARGQDGAMLRFTLGTAYAREKHYEEAVRHLREAVRLDPGYSAAWQALGRALESSGDRAGALDAYREGLGAAEAAGDMQVLRALRVFVKRLEKV